MCVTQQLDVVSTVSIIQQDSTVKDVKMERGETQQNSNAKVGNDSLASNLGYFLIIFFYRQNRFFLKLHSFPCKRTHNRRVNIWR